MTRRIGKGQPAQIGQFFDAELSLRKILKKLEPMRMADPLSDLCKIGIDGLLRPHLCHLCPSIG